MNTQWLWEIAYLGPERDGKQELVREYHVAPNFDTAVAIAAPLTGNESVEIVRIERHVPVLSVLQAQEVKP